MSLSSVRRLAIPIAVGAAIGAGPAAASGSTTWVVTNGLDLASGASCPSASDCTLREAISDAHDGDTVEVPVPGCCTVTQGPLQIDASITLQGIGPESAEPFGSPPTGTIIDAAGSSGVIRISGPAPGFAESNASVTLRDLTVQGGSVTDGSADADSGGAGIDNNSTGTLRLYDVSVRDNKLSATPAAGEQDVGGAGIFSRSTVDLTESTVLDNTLTVSGAQGFSGGAGTLVTGGDLILDHSAFQGNTATITATGAAGDNGGGGALVAPDADDAILRHAEFLNNTLHLLGVGGAAGDGGGGLAFDGVSIDASASTFANNLADLGTDGAAAGGGAIVDAGGSSTYSNVTFADNSVATGAPVAGQGGGAIYSSGGSSRFAHATFSGNSPGTGGTAASIYADGSQLEFDDSILSSGSAGTANCTLTNGALADSDGYNLYDDNPDSCALSVASDRHSAELGLTPLADNGGPVVGTEGAGLIDVRLSTLTIRPAPGSPAVDAGDPRAGSSVDAFGQPLGIDERGVARPQPAGGRCDIGAVELAPPVVTTGVAGALSPSAATLQGTAVNPDPTGLNLSGTTHFEYGTTTAYGTSTPDQKLAQDSTLAPTARLTGLRPGVYHYRLVASDTDGTTDGADSTFVVPSASTAATRPAVLTGLAKSVQSKTAKVTGQLDGFGLATKWRFEFGTSRKYGRATKLMAVAARSRVRSVSSPLTGLTPGRTYHYRLVATSSAGKTVGADRTFRTKPVHHRRRRR